MPKETTKEQRYEDLVTAVAGGELKMVKFLWNLLSEIDDLVNQTPQSIIEKRVREVDEILKRLKANPPKNGKTPTKEELLALITPRIPKPVHGKNGKTPTVNELLALIEPLIPDMPVAIPGPQGKPGPRGVGGRIPKHEWRGTFIRFELPGGEWGPWTNLQGVPSEGGGPSTPFGGSPEVTIKAGQDISVRRDASGAYVITYTGTGGSGGGTTYEVPIGTIDGQNASFVVTEEPKSVISDGLKYFDGAGYTYSAPNVVMDIPPSSFIRAEIPN